jgi:hypothetical protein
MAVVTQALEKRRAAAAARIGVKDVTQPAEQAVTAAAALIPLDGTGWKTFKLGDAKWQRDAWHQYDINGDLRTIGNWIGKACSRARLYLAEVDANGRPGKEVEDPRLQIIAETMFGSPSAKAEAQRLLGIHLFVPGESFIIAEAADNANEDRWYVVSTSDIRREGERTITVKRPQQFGGGEYTLKPGTDLLIRCWTPHPDKYDLADSSVRPGLIPLRAIEQYTKMEFAEVDSRLAGAGILFVPEEMDFPKQGKEKNDATGLSAALTRTMSAAMANREDASSLVPIVVQVPGELIGQIQHITFFSELQQHLAERMDQAVNRLARTLEIEPEILTGKADMNHWSAWQVDESTINIHVSPLLSRMCDALTAGYVRAALQVLGEDPDSYVLWYDTSMLTVEPDRQKDALELWDKGLLSDAATRKAGGWAEGEEPDEAELEKRFAMHLVDLDPSKIEWEDVRKAIGGNIAKWTPPAAPAEGADQPDSTPSGAQPDVPGGGTPNPDNMRRLPERQPNARESRQAAALRVGAHMAVLRALELSGKRLLTRGNRDRYQDTPAHELHTKIRVGDMNRVNELLASADGPAVDLTMLAEESEVDEEQLATLLASYCGEMMVRGVRHNADLLGHYLSVGLHAACGDVCYAPAHPGRCDDDARMQFHLPGRHDQKTHGNRAGKPRANLPGVGPFKPAEKAARASQRRARIDPDRNAPAPDRQGKRAFAEWSAEARRLTHQFKRELEDNQRHREQEEDQRRKTEDGRNLSDREKRAALEAEWQRIDKEIEAERSRKVANALRNGAKNGLTVAEMSETIEGYNAAAAREKRLARERHFAGDNPTALRPLEEADNFWTRQLTADTGFDPKAGVPIEGTVEINANKMRNGYAFRQDGVTYAIEVETDDSEAGKREYAATVAARLHDAANRVLPPDHADYQWGVAWFLNRSTDDGRASAQYGGRVETAASASAHGRSTAIFSGRKHGVPNTTTDGYMRHEFGHHFDNAKRGFSRGPEWRAANAMDWDRNNMGARRGQPSKEFKEHLLLPQFVSPSGTHEIKPFTQTMGSGFNLRVEQPEGVTSYGKANRAEDFAEAIALHHAGQIGTAFLPGREEEGPKPMYFRDVYPNRAAIFDEWWPEVAERQRAAILRERG